MNPQTPHNLLPKIPAFVGRESAINALFTQVSEQRVSQLCGPMGIGKSELARAVGHHAIAAGEFPQGVWQIDLDGAEHPSTLVGDLVMQLGYDESKPLSHSFDQRRILIIWDQMDQQPEHRQAWVDDILMERFAEIDGVHHLIVARQKLDDLPSVQLEPLDSAASEDAFVAQLPNSVSARPEPGDAALSAALKLLEGNPLAIQIAASSCNPPRWTDELLDLLANVKLSENEANPGLSRAVGMGLSGINSEAVRLLNLLHAFPGGASNETLFATFGNDWEAPLKALELSGLWHAKAGRTTLAPALRHYVAKQLGPARANTFREQAAVFLHQLMRNYRTQVEFGNLAPALTFATQEWSNLRSAFCWAVNRMDRGSIDVEDDCELILDYCFVMFHLFTTQGMFHEGLSWMIAGKAATIELQSHHQSALLQDYIGVLHAQLGHRAAAKEALENALDLFRQLREAPGVASAGYHVALLHYEDGELDAAQTLFEEIVPLLRGGNNRAFAAQASTYLGQTYLAQGDMDTAFNTLEEAMELYQEGTISPDLRVNALFGLARAALATEREETAVQRIREALHVACTIGPRLATTSVPNLLQAAEGFLRHNDGAHFPALASEVSDLVVQLDTAVPDPSTAKAWQMTYRLMTQVSALLSGIATLRTDDDATDASREKVSQIARELDTMSGGLMGVEQWANGWLTGPTPHT